MFCLFNLPSAITGAHVFSFLSLTALARVDTAVAVTFRRHELLEAFSITSLENTTCSKYNRDGVRSKIWRWCVDRQVALKLVEFWSADADQVPLLLEVLNRRSSNAQYHCNLSDGQMELVIRVLSNDAIRNRITTLEVNGDCESALRVDNWGELKALKTLRVIGGAFSEQALLQILDGKLCLKAAHFDSMPILSKDAVQALSLHGDTLTSVVWRGGDYHSSLLSTLGKHCYNLETLQIYHFTGDVARTNEAGWLAVATRCHKLRTVDMWRCPGCIGAVFIAFAANCSELHTLSVKHCGSTVTDAVLGALAKGCPKLLDLQCDMWAVESVSAVDAAQQLLSRLERCPLDCSASTPPAALARAVTHMHSVKTLSLDNLSAAHLVTLSDIPTVPTPM
jgi:hypothetical protein